MSAGNSSNAAKIEERDSLDAEILYFKNSIISHQHQIDKLKKLEIIPFFKRSANAMIAEEQAGISVATSAIQRYTDLEIYYKSIGRL
jgi:hypothetical protein